MLLSTTSLVAALSGGCGVGALGNAVSPKIQAEGAVLHGGERPLLVDWGPSDRTLFDASRARGPLVVGFVGGRLEPLYNCHASGQYTYSAEHSAQVQDDIIDNADELHAKMPTFGVNYEGVLQRTGKLHVRMKVVGLYATDKTTFTRADLRGEECDRATHVATYVTIGAFRLFTLSRGELKGDVAVPIAGADVGGGSHADEQTLNEAGDERACDKASPGDAQPPDGCSTSLQFVIVPIVGSSGPSEATIASAAAPSSQPSAPEAAHGLGPQKTLAIVAGGAGVVGLAVGTIFGLKMSSEWSQAQTDCGTGCGPNAPAQAERNDAHSAGNVATVAFIAGGALVAAGAVLWLTAPSGNAAQATGVEIRMTPAVDASAAGAMVVGRF
jgi:hypothetical protein